MGNNKKQILIDKEDGNALSLVVVLLLSMTLLAMASATLAKTQLTKARFSRQTSNSYHLARSGAEKMVDTMNKEIAMELPRIMKEASNLAQEKMVKTDASKDGISYEIKDSLDPYSGNYIGRDYDNEYEINLRKLIYDHINKQFIGPTGPIDAMVYEAYSDVPGQKPINITTKIYNKVTVTEEIKKAIGKLEEDDFVVEVIAVAAEGTKTSLTKSRVIGKIELDQLIADQEELLEEYEWADVFPEALQSAVISFGDLIVQNKNTTIEGNVHIKGTQRKPIEFASGNFPDSDEKGGITVSSGGDLTVKGSALVVSNIQIANLYQNDPSTKITITEDAISSNIAIHDNYYIGHNTNEEPWNNYVTGGAITIGRNAYVDNDIRIERYIENGKINITGSAFGISDGPTSGKTQAGVTIVDPNLSSGIFSMGENSKITMGRAFIAGQAFIDFGDGNGYHRLYESVGEPFQEVYYLDKYRPKEDGTKEFEGDPAYINELEELISKDKVEIKDRNAVEDKPYAYAPSYISEGGKIHKVSGDGVPGEIFNQATAREIFYKGLDPVFSHFDKLATNSDWLDPVEPQDPDHPTAPRSNWKDVITNPYNFYNGANYFNKEYGITLEESKNMATYKGLQGYMFAKRGIFYSQFEKDSSSTINYTPVERTFSDIVDVSVFDGKSQDWSYNNPILVVNNDQSINISTFGSIPTAIVCLNKDKTITLTSTGTDEFNGIIITPGKLKIASGMTINGVIIAGNEYEGNPSSLPIRENIQAGAWAGVQISANNVSINYDKDQILAIKFMEKSLQRKLYDSLKLTNYKGSHIATTEQEKINTIMGPVGDRKIKLSSSSVISSKQGGLQFVMKSLKKI